VAALQSTCCSALELAYLCAYLLEACVFASPPFPGEGKVSDPPADYHYQHVVMVCYLFLNAEELSDCGCPGTEPCSLLPLLLPYCRQQPITLLLSALLPFVYGWFAQVQLLATPHFSSVYHMMLGAHMFVLLKVSQARLELAAVVAAVAVAEALLGVRVAAHLFSQCNVVWRSLLWARGLGGQCFNSLWCFTSAKHCSSVSARSLIYGAHTVCVCVPVTILDSSQLFSLKFIFYSRILSNISFSNYFSFILSNL
jgi:hypothetical protein